MVVGWLGSDLEVAGQACERVEHAGDKPSIEMFPTVRFLKMKIDTKPRELRQIQDLLYIESNGSTEDMDHDLLPDNRIFSQWVPLVDDPGSVRTKQDSSYSPVIYFKTRRLFARISTRDEGGLRIGKPWIMSADDSVIGYLDNMSQYDDEVGPDVPVELVWIDKMAVT
jgi:hypothetical protein